MVALQLQRVLYKKINSCFDVKDEMAIQIQNNFSINVNYSDDCKTCYATLESVSRASDNPDNFNIRIELVGLFSCDGIERDEDKQFAHMLVYNCLFPYVQSMVADLSSKAGLPPLILEAPKLDMTKVVLNG